MEMINKNVKQVMLQPLKREHIALKIKGITPLLMEKLPMEVVERYDKKKSKQMSSKDDKSEEEKLQDKTYYTEDGNVGFPASGFAKGMVEVAPYIDGLDKKKVRGSVRILGNIIPINFKKQTVNKSYGKTSGRTKSPRLILRPEYQDWSCELQIVYNKTNISMEQIINLINWAGFQMGLGGFRPACGGSYGQYEVMKNG